MSTAEVAASSAGGSSTHARPATASYGAGARVLAQATDHLDRRGILGIEGREREHPQARVAGGLGEPRHFGERGWIMGGQPGSHLGRGRRLVLLGAALKQLVRIHRGELGLGEGYRRFDRLMAGWLRASR
jgi:hypothetical protein